MSDISVGRPAPDETKPLESDKSLGELVTRLTGDFGDLVNTHVQLAKAELKEEAGRAARGSGLLAAAGLSGVLALILLSFAAAWGLAEAMPNGVAFLIVGAVWLVLTIVLAMSGRTAMQRLRGMPQTTTSIKEDIEWAHRPTS
jgi:uncharacterized membrane protein YqjE